MVVKHQNSWENSGQDTLVWFSKSKSFVWCNEGEEYRKGFLYLRNFDRIGEAKIARSIPKFRPCIVHYLLYFAFIFGIDEEILNCCCTSAWFIRYGVLTSCFLCQTIESSPRGGNQGEEVALSQLVACVTFV